jgi:hypothetical protein
VNGARTPADPPLGRFRPERSRRDLPILTIRTGGNSTTAEHLRTVEHVATLLASIDRHACIRGELISGRYETLESGSTIAVSIDADGVEIRLQKRGSGERGLVIRTPDPYARSSSSRYEDGDFPATTRAVLSLALEALRADLMPKDERDALDARRLALGEAIASTVMEANGGDISEVMIMPPGPVIDDLRIHVSTEGHHEGALITLSPQHQAWMPIRCAGLALTTTERGLIVQVKEHHGSMVLATPSDPIAIMRSIGERTELPPAPPPIVHDLDWDVTF